MNVQDINMPANFYSMEGGCFSPFFDDTYYSQSCYNVCLH